MSLYEGTNGIQSMDLMGRKMRMREGACLTAFHEEINAFCSANQDHPKLGPSVKMLAQTVHALLDMSRAMVERMGADPLQWASYTYSALTAFGEVTMTWRLLDLARIAFDRSQKKGSKYDFHRGKVLQATYFAETTLPHTRATIHTCLREGREIMDMPNKAF